jgi:Fe-S-cluster-containing dehydrogenase component
VRCGHCAHACAEVHGVSRLVRRGDKLVTRMSRGDAPPPGEVLLPKSLLLPNTCQHCENAACMLECPTGAIGRDESGEVFIRDELCTGCGACAKACPWENIQMAPRAAVQQAGAVPAAQRDSAGAARSAELAVKCDLCRGHEAPACVTACPTEAIVRVDPTQAFHEVRALLGRSSSDTPLARSTPVSQAARSGVSLALGLAVLVELARRAASLSPAHGVGLGCGVVAAALTLLAAAYIVPKRAIRWWMRVRAGAKNRAERGGGRASAPGMRRLVGLHVTLGAVALAATLGHAGFGSARGFYLPLSLSLWTALISGALSAAAYRWLPRRLTPLERTGLLPEDLAAERRRLLEVLESGISQRSAVVKALFSGLILPYERSALASAGLAVSGRGLRDAERRLRGRVDELLAGRGRDRLDGIEPLIRAAVELSALRGRRVLTALLRGLPMIHAVSSVVFVLLLVVHVAGAVVGRLWIGSPS